MKVERAPVRVPDDLLEDLRARLERTRFDWRAAEQQLEQVLPAFRAVERKYDLVQWSEMPRGGHFAVLEEPGLLVDDVRLFFRRLRGRT